MSLEHVHEPVNVIQGKGEFIGGGSTGLVERLECGDIVKSPWTGRPEESLCKQELAIEAQIYKRLGPHPRLVPFRHWDPAQHTLTLGYMSHGSLKAYVKNRTYETSFEQQQQWALEAAEAIEHVHRHGVIQSDVGPHNFLLDEQLGLRICDFGGSSLDGSKATVASAVRYSLPRPPDDFRQPPTVQHDLFALGSTIYFIVVGHDPYDELTNEGEIEGLFAAGIFPALSGLLLAEVIESCWREDVESATEIVNAIRDTMLSPSHASSQSDC